MTDTDRSKKELRREYRSRRASIDTAQKAAFDNAICESIIASAEFLSADTLLTYYPIGSEIDITPIAERALSLGKSVAYPVCDTESSTLTFKYIPALSELTVGSYSIPEPSESDEIFRDKTSALCIVPALAVDKSGVRLGYGRGYYDRFLKSFSGTAIVAIYTDLITDALPRDKYDIPLEFIVTERGNIIINAEKEKGKILL